MLLACVKIAHAIFTAYAMFTTRIVNRKLQLVYDCCIQHDLDFEACQFSANCIRSTRVARKYVITNHEIGLSRLLRD